MPVLSRWPQRAPVDEVRVDRATATPCRGFSACCETCQRLLQDERLFVVLSCLQLML